MRKAFLSFLFLALSMTCFSQIKVLAELVEPGKGILTRIVKYKVIKVLENDLPGFMSDDLIHSEIRISYHFYTEPAKLPQSALLTLTKPNIKDYAYNVFIFPAYNAEENIETVSLVHINFSQWEACETGQGNCEPFIITRKPDAGKLIYVMPCGGSFTSVELHPYANVPLKDEPVLETHVSIVTCPPVFNLTNLPDGKYTAYMVACGLGGPVEFSLITKAEK